MSTVIIVGDKLQARSIGDQILCTNLGIDWAAAGLTMFLRVQTLGGASRDLPLAVVTGQPQQCFLATTATTFPTGTNYEAQIIGKNGTTETRFSNVFSIYVAENLSPP